jgi:hypothetical protein
MFNTKVLPTNLGHYLKDRILIRKAVKGKSLIQHEQQPGLFAIDAKMIHLIRLEYLIPKLSQVLKAQDSLSLSGKAFYLSKNHLSLVALQKDLNRARNLIQSPNLNKNHIQALTLIIDQLANLVPVINEFKFSFESAQAITKERDKTFKELVKLIKKTNQEIYIRP